MPAVAELAAFARADEPLAPFTTYRVGGRAAVFAMPRTIEELALVGQTAARSGLPVIVVGRGSNMLVADDGFVGIAVSLQSMADGIAIEGSIAGAGAAVALPVVARQTAAVGLTGFEWAVGVPGSIGGAVRMNAGGHGSDMAAHLIDAEVFDLVRGDLTVRTPPELGLRFRGSDLSDDHVVLSCRLQLAVGDRRQSESTIAEIVRWRREHQPGGQNCGSVFVNPVPGEVTAGELIDRCGLRGWRCGGAFVSDKHANFIQAGEGATAADVRTVMETVRRRVAETTGFVMRSEVRLVGFPDSADGPDEPLEAS